METRKKLSTEIRDQLNAEFPTKAYKQHPTKKYLGTLKPQYIIQRLNNVFGIGGWELIHEVVERTVNEVLVKGKIILFDYDIHTSYQYGSHHTEGKGVEIGDGYKSAVTDCLSKCASYLEVGNNLFLGNITFNDNGKPVLNTKTVMLSDIQAVEYNVTAPLAKPVEKPKAKPVTQSQFEILGISEKIYNSFASAKEKGSTIAEKIDNLKKAYDYYAPKASKPESKKALDDTLEYFSDMVNAGL